GAFLLKRMPRSGKVARAASRRIITIFDESAGIIGRFFSEGQEGDFGHAVLDRQSGRGSYPSNQSADRIRRPRNPPSGTNSHCHAPSIMRSVRIPSRSTSRYEASPPLFDAITM